MKILLTGGGSGGSVAPLLAVAGQIKKYQSQVQFLFVGTKNGPEKNMVQSAGLEFQAIVAAKWRRYFSFQNLFAPVLIAVGFYQAWRLLGSFRPDCIFGTGSYVQVPIIWAAWFFKIPCVIHQQDIYPSLANKLCELFVRRITVCFEKSQTDFASGFGLFYKKRSLEKVSLVGNPFREELSAVTREKGLKFFKLRPDMPVLLVLGGGTGSEFFNNLVTLALFELAQAVQIIHAHGSRNYNPLTHKNYRGYKFIEKMDYAYSAADVVLSRAGMSTLTELSNLGKLSIIIPLPGTHQEYNALLVERLKAALVFKQSEVTPQGLVSLIRKLLFDSKAQKVLITNILKLMPKNSSEKIARIILVEAERKSSHE